VSAGAIARRCSPPRVQHHRRISATTVKGSASACAHRKVGVAPAARAKRSGPGGVLSGVSVVADQQHPIHTGLIGVSDHRTQARRPGLARVVEPDRIDNDRPHPTGGHHLHQRVAAPGCSPHPDRTTGRPPPARRRPPRAAPPPARGQGRPRPSGGSHGPNAQRPTPRAPQAARPWLSGMGRPAFSRRPRPQAARHRGPRAWPWQ